MTKFEALFGIKESEIKNTCVLMPLIPKNSLEALGIKKLSRGKIYSSGNSRHFTLINTGIGAGFTGDSALYLSDTNCKNLILFGSCGLVRADKNLDIGSLVAPFKCYAMESFTDMLLKNNASGAFYPDLSLLDKFLAGKNEIQKITCATLGSLKLEEENLDLLKEKDIQAVDMECSSFFSAAKHRHLNAMAFFYVSDIINKKPFYSALSREDETRLSFSIQSGIKSICSFIK
ncbi:MAG: hypothetical protein Q8N76_07050 [Candidatus Omnitrophota bacterium]|nr:hypothetical protein [Candidatus Omnitrophota bacterium]